MSVFNGFNYTETALVNAILERLYFFYSNTVLFHKLYAAFAVAGFIMNALEVGFLCHKGKQRTTFDLVILSLSVSDLLISMAFVVQSGCLLINRYFFQKMPKFIYFTLACSFLSSHLHAMFIAVNRLCAVVFPFKVKRVFSRCHCVIGLSFIWTTSIGISLAMTFNSSKQVNNPKSRLVTSCIIISSVALLVMLYSCLLIVVKRRSAIPCPKKSSIKSEGYRLFICIDVGLPFLHTSTSNLLTTPFERKILHHQVFVFV